MKIFSGEMEVYKSGSVNSDDLKPITFSLLDNPAFNVIVKVLFNEASTQISYDITGDGEITFKFENPDLLDFGFSNPVKIGFIDGRELSVVFRVTIHGEKSSYTLNYTFYQKVEKC